MSKEIEEYIENIMTTFPDMNQSHRRMMQKVGCHQQKKIDELYGNNCALLDTISWWKSREKNWMKNNDENLDKIQDLEAEVEKMEHILENNLLCRKMDKKKIDELEEKLEKAVKKINYALSQKDQDYGMDSVYDIHQFRQRKVFSILEETLEEIEKGE